MKIDTLIPVVVPLLAVVINVSIIVWDVAVGAMSDSLQRSSR